MSAYAASFALWSNYCLRLDEEKMKTGDFESLKAKSLADGRMNAEEIEKCTTAKEISELWQAEVMNKNLKEPELTFDNFKELILVISADAYGISAHAISSSQAQKVATFAFQLLDIDQSNTITFTEFENILGTYNAVSLLLGNQITWWQVRLEKKKRQIALAADPDSTENQKLMLLCAEDVDQYNHFVSPLNSILGLPQNSIDHFSLVLCIAHAFCIAFYDVEKSVDDEKRIDWVLRAFTLMQAFDATLRLIGLAYQPNLTSRRRQEMEGAGIWKLFVVTKHQHNPRETIKNRTTLILCWLSLLAAIIDIIRQFGMGSGWNDDTAVALKMIMALPILRIFILLEAVNQLLYSFVASLGPVALYGKLLLAIMYFYTVIGYYAFSDDCNFYFNDCISSFISLVRLFIGEGWHGLMYPCIDATHKMTMLYFMSYIAIVSVAFSALFVSLVFQMYAVIETQRQNGEVFVYIRDKLQMISDDKLSDLMGRILDADLDDSFDMPSLHNHTVTKTEPLVDAAAEDVVAKLDEKEDKGAVAEVDVVAKLDEKEDKGAVADVDGYAIAV